MNNNLDVNEADILLNDIVALYHTVISQLPFIALGIFILLAFYFAAKPISHWLAKPLTYRHKSALVKLVTQRIIGLLIILLGLYIFLRLAGLSQFAIAILSGTGVVGLIIGFAFKDIAENFMSSLLLSIQKPFRLGEIIEVNGHTGVVKQVTARATTLIDFDGNHIQIPNATVYKNTIRNFTANPNTRGSFIIGIGYDADPTYAQKIALEVLAEIDAVLKEPEPQVLIDELASSTYNLAVYFWTNTHQNSLFKVQSVAMKKITLRFLEENISMPDNDRERIFPEPLTVIEQKPKKLESPKKSPKSFVADDHAIDDVSSDDAEIRKQAEQARAPEQGSNIL